MPADDLVLNVRQISSYSNQGIQPTDNLLIQRGGLGGPYLSVGAQQLVSEALADTGPLLVGTSAPGSAFGSQVIANWFAGRSLVFNAYLDGTEAFVALNSGYSAYFDFDIAAGDHVWGVAAPASAGADVLFTTAMTLDSLGNLDLPLGSLAVAQDPVLPNAVATKRWVEAQVAATVTSFNGRTGPVCLWIQDILAAGGAPIYSPRFQGWPMANTPCPGSCNSQLATTAFVHGSIAEYIGAFLDKQPNVATWNGRTGNVVLTLADIEALGFPLPGYAPIDSPNFTGYPTAPTAAPGANSGQIATTAFVHAAIVQNTTGVASFNTRTGVVTLLVGDITGAGGAAANNAALTGVPTAPTASLGTSTTQLATTAFVAAAIATVSGVASFNGRSGTVILISGDITSAGGALSASPNLTGVPLAPTAPIGTNTQQLATTAFVMTALTQNAVSSFNSRVGAVSLIANDISAAGGALLISPAFTGVPTAPTAAPGTNSTQIATCAFVQGILAAGNVTSFNTRTGAITLTLGDVTAAGGAPLASPILTGVPAAPTATAGTNTTQLATCAFVQAALAGSVAGVASFNSRTGTVTLTNADVVGVLPPSNANPAMDGTASAGLGGTWSRFDHVHPTDTTRAAASALANYLPLSGGFTTGPMGFGGTTNGVVLSQGSLGNGMTIFLGGSQRGVLFFAGATSVLTLEQFPSQGSYAIDNTGTGYVSGNLAVAGTVSEGSDARGKHGFEQAEDGLEIVRDLQPKRFVRNPPDGISPRLAETVELGFVAQDVQPVLSEAVGIAPLTGQLGIHPTALIAVLVNAVKQLDARLAALEAT